jgi:hypothetical protein
VIWIGAEAVVTVPLPTCVYVGRTPPVGALIVGWTVTDVPGTTNVEEEEPVMLADSVAGLVAPVTVGMGIVEMGASEVREVTP